MIFLCLKMIHQFQYTGVPRISYIINSHPLILFNTPNSDPHTQLTNKHIELSHSGAVSTKPTLQNLCVLSKFLMYVRTVVFVCLFVWSYYFVAARNFSSIITLRPLVLTAVICPTYHPTYALYIYLVSRAVQVSLELFYVFSVPGNILENSTI